MFDERALDRIIATVRNVANCHAIVLGADTPLLSSGLVDSLSMEELAVSLEQEFGVRLDVSDLGFDNADTPAQLLTLVRDRG